MICIKCGRQKELKTPCRPCLKEYKHNWYLANSELQNQKSRERYHANKPERAKKAKEYYKANFEHIIAKSTLYYRDHSETRKVKIRAWKDQRPGYDKTWDDNHPGNRKQRFHKFRGIKAGAIGSFTAEEWCQVVSEQLGMCSLCLAERELEADHIIPLSKGGSNAISNIQGVCATCNRKKGDRLVCFSYGEAS